jgi:CheY-like chemotaxis protein
MGSCAFLKLMFLDLGYRSTRTACSADRALVLASAFSPALVLLELGLPDMSVHRLAQMMRLHARTNVCRLNLIAMAAREASCSTDLARAAGFDGYLAKPVRAPALNHMLWSLRL